MNATHVRIFSDSLLLTCTMQFVIFVLLGFGWVCSAYFSNINRCLPRGAIFHSATTGFLFVRFSQVPRRTVAARWFLMPPRVRVCANKCVYIVIYIYVCCCVISFKSRIVWVRKRYGVLGQLRIFKLKFFCCNYDLARIFS